MVVDATVTAKDNPSIDAGQAPPLVKLTRPPAVDAPDDDQLLDPILRPTDKVNPLLYPTAFLIFIVYDPDWTVAGTSKVRLVAVEAVAGKTVVTEETVFLRLTSAKLLLS